MSQRPLVAGLVITEQVVRWGGVKSYNAEETTILVLTNITYIT